MRLLTLVGPPGIGKTRLAISLAEDLRADFPDGVCFVALAPVADPERFPEAVAQTLRVKERPGADLLSSVCDSLGARRVLLVLDNFEHLLGAAPLVAALLGTCPRLKVLATSRAPLRLGGERELPVPPLAFPEPAPGPEVPGPPPQALTARLATYDAVRLFVARVQQRVPGFAISAENGAVIGELCARLEGLPLAVELAAARTKMLPPDAILARLDQRLSLLTGGPRDAPARQQTLRAAIAWSYELLAPPEQSLFRRLAVFGGGFTLEAAEAVCAEGGAAQPTGAGPDLLDAVSALVDHSLVRLETPPDDSGGEPRFGMFETIREFALERLEASGEAAELRHRFVRYYVGLAARLAGRLRPLSAWAMGPPEAASAEPVLAALSREHDNFRAALAWSCAEARDASEDGREPAGEAAVRLAAALWRLWLAWGDRGEGRRRLSEVLALPQAAGAEARANACFGAGILAAVQADSDDARARLEESASICEALGDEAGRGRALVALGEVAQSLESDWAGARAHFEEGLALLRKIGDRVQLVQALRTVANAALSRGAYGEAAALFGEALDLYRSLHDPAGIAWALIGLGHLAREEGDGARSATLLEQSLALYRGLGDGAGEAAALHNLAEALRLQGDADRASALYEESLAYFRSLPGSRAPGLVVRSLQALGNLALQAHDPPRAAALFAESLALLPRVAGPMRARLLEVCLAGLGGVALRAGQPDRAARLFGAAAASAARRDGRLPAADRAVYERDAAALRAQLGESGFEAGRAVGRSLSPDDALTEAQAVADAVAASAGGASDRIAAPAEPAGSHARSPADSLTPREREVARLVARGLSNREIAAALVIADRTAATHVEHILTKLGARSRTQIAAWAAERGLLGGDPPQPSP